VAAASGGGVAGVTRKRVFGLDSTRVLVREQEHVTTNSTVGSARGDATAEREHSGEAARRSSGKQSSMRRSEREREKWPASVLTTTQTSGARSHRGKGGGTVGSMCGSRA
jgi:hypothetical protein